jgi:hypothetical protein
MIWWKEQLSSERTLPNKEGGCWLDYFGLHTRITDAGGWIVVSLSHKGIEYLNEIADRVSSLTTTTV